MALAVVCASTAPPLIAATTAPALAIAFWRTGLGALAVMPFAVLRRRDELRRAAARAVALALRAGGGPRLLTGRVGRRLRRAARRTASGTRVGRYRARPGRRRDGHGRRRVA